MSLKVPEVSIQHKILVGHLILFAIIACIFGILQHERMRISDIEKEARHIQQVQRKVNTAHRHITLLAMLGETAISWERKDFADYRSLRQYVDSTLLDIRKENEIHVAQIKYSIQVFFYFTRIHPFTSSSTDYISIASFPFSSIRYFSVFPIHDI
jgi:hypothetical protein